ncbi:MAG: alkaline phosphatase, partial [Proteobacteria bacterium]|nr:alkaline phosphatase [Pseudomonadota bacterium]
MKLPKLTILLLTVQLTACAHTTDISKQVVVDAKKESPEWWYQQGAKKVKQLANQRKFPKQAKNVILFIGDGMNLSTTTAARILEGQQAGQPGEENQLSFEKFPQTALSKTYNTNFQTSHSPGAMTAMITGVKTKGNAISVDGGMIVGDCDSGKGRNLMTLLELAEINGMSTGVVTTASLTHATPAATYSHSVSRYWESDADIPQVERDKGCKDIASQLIDFPYGDGLEVAMGGGRTKFIPSSVSDPEYKNQSGERLDNRDLMKEWKSKYKDSEVVWNKEQFKQVKAKETKHLLGLFEPSHMQYEHDRPNDKAGEPSLQAMTKKAIKILKNSDKPFFLMVEAGRIDHGHHAGNAYRALTDTIELSNAVAAALQQVDLNETLIIVTADHSHTFNMGGYPQRGNPILGLVKSTTKAGNLAGMISKD